MTTPEPTTAELKEAFKASRLWVFGVTFERAIASPLVMWSLRHDVMAARKKYQSPLQPRLI